MQLSNRNAYILCQYLGIPEDGHMHPRELMNKMIMLFKIQIKLLNLQYQALIPNTMIQMLL